MIEIYAKRQRAKRKNQQQEAIVSGKDTINERTTKLISLMKAVKSGWNGGPSPELGVEKFNLTQPIPDVVVGSGDAALHELSEIVQMLKQIKTLQDTYANAHAQRAEKLKQIQPQQQETTAPTTTVSAALVANEYLLKVASNPLTRIWSHITAYNPFISEKNRGERLALLRSLARMNDGLKDLEDHILSTNESSIFDSVYLAKQLYIDAKSSFFATFRKNIDSIITETDKELTTVLEEVNKRLKDVGVESGDNSRLKPTNVPVLEDLKDKVEQLQVTIHDSDVDTTETVSAPLKNQTDQIQLPAENELITPTQTTEPLADSPVSKSDKVKSKGKGKKTTKKRNRKLPIAPVVKPVVNDFVDNDIEENAQVKYQAIAQYLYNNINVLVRSAIDIVNKNLPEPWGTKIKQEYSNAFTLGNSIISKLANGDDYEQEYVDFLRVIGTLKSIEYIASVEVNTKLSNPEFEYGEMLDESDIKAQADNFARIEYNKYTEVAEGKVAQASEASRFLKRMITHIIPRKDKTLRLMVSRNIRQAINGLQGMMDVLEERHLNFRRLAFAGSVFFESLKNVYDGLADIADMYNSGMRIEKSHRKQKNVKMTYDLIPTTDISNLRSVTSMLDKDISNLQKLEGIESLIMEATKPKEENHE